MSRPGGGGFGGTTVDRRTVATLLRHELRMLIRSGRTVLISIVVPILILPAMFWLQTRSMERQVERSARGAYQFAVTGSQTADAVLWIERATILGEEQTASAARSMPGQPTADRATFERVAVEGDHRRAYDDGEIDFWIETTTLGALRAEATEQADDGSSHEKDAEESSQESDESELPDETPVLRFNLRGDVSSSQSGVQILRRRLSEVRSSLRADRLAAAGLDLRGSLPFEFSQVDLARAEEASGLLLGRFLTSILLMMLISGGSIVAMDSLAGEKERGTLETLLTSAASRTEIVSAKSLAILLVALFIATVQAANLLIWVGLGMLPLPPGMEFSVSPMQAVLLGVLFLPLAALVASTLLLVSGRARTYREAQLFFFPVFLVLLLPSLVTVLPALELRSAMVLVPISNLALAVKSLLAGTPDWPMTAIAWLVNAAVAAVVGTVTLKSLTSERLITTNDRDEADLVRGSELLGRHVVRLFLVAGAIYFVTQLFFSEETDLRFMLLVNMTIISVLPLVVASRYRIAWPELLSLRSPRHLVWLGVVLAAPFGVFALSVVANAWSSFLGVSDSWLEQFTRALLPERYGLLTLIFFIAVVPAILEELAFRGVLLHGIRQRFGPLATILLTGIMFGFFHVTLMRIVPTAVLGFLLAWLVLRTGSIYPAIIWHFLNNATAVLADRLGGDREFTSMHVAGAWVPFLVGLSIIWFATRKDPRSLGSDGNGDLMPQSLSS